MCNILTISANYINLLETLIRMDVEENMETNNTAPTEQISLKDLMALHKAEFPQQAKDVLTSYLEDADENTSNELQAALSNAVYEEKFNTAITYTAFVVFLLLKKVLGGTDDFNAYIKEFLMTTATDDIHIKKMRTYFFKVYSEDDEVVQTLLGVSDEVSKLFTKEIGALSQKYKLLQGIK